MIDWIVAAVTLFAVCFVLLWLLAAGFRARVEQPKLDMLARESRLSRNKKDSNLLV